MNAPSNKAQTLNLKSSGRVPTANLRSAGTISLESGPLVVPRLTLQCVCARLHDASQLARARVGFSHACPVCHDAGLAREFYTLPPRHSESLTMAGTKRKASEAGLDEDRPSEAELERLRRALASKEASTVRQAAPRLVLFALLRELTLCLRPIAQEMGLERQTFAFATNKDLALCFASFFEASSAPPASIIYRVVSQMLSQRDLKAESATAESVATLSQHLLLLRAELAKVLRDGTELDLRVLTVAPVLCQFFRNPDAMQRAKLGIEASQSLEHDPEGAYEKAKAAAAAVPAGSAGTSSANTAELFRICLYVCRAPDPVPIADYAVWWLQQFKRHGHQHWQIDEVCEKVRRRCLDQGLRRRRQLAEAARGAGGGWSDMHAAVVRRGADEAASGAECAAPVGVSPQELLVPLLAVHRVCSRFELLSCLLLLTSPLLRCAGSRCTLARITLSR
jgi:hypothetical protein